jgi:integrase
MTTSRTRRGRTKDMTGIRGRGGTYQVRIFGGQDPVTGRQVILTGSAPSVDDAIVIRDRFRADVASNKSARTQATLSYLLREWLTGHSADPNTVEDYRFLAERFIIPVLGDASLTKLARVGPRSFEKIYADLRRCRVRCDGRPFIEHHKDIKADATGHECGSRCKPHVCEPLAESTVLKTHIVLNGAFKAAVRWGWMGVNPMEATLHPHAPKPKPHPPSAVDAARIIDKAFSMDDDWGTFVWLTMITGARRGELVALRWHDVHLRCASCGVGVDWHDERCGECDRALHEGRTALLDIRRGYRRRSGRTKENDTKDHQMRLVALDVVTVGLLVDQKRRYEERIRVLGGTIRNDAYIFSYAPDHSRPCNPDGITHKYSKMTAAIGIDTHVHELRHYSATELLTAGVDLRTVAGRLGHAEGVTTLRFYAAWVQGADERAPDVLVSRLPRKRKKSGDNRGANRFSCPR